LELNTEHPIKSETSQLKSGDTVWAKVQGRKGKLVVVRAIVDSLPEGHAIVELYPELSLPVRFLVTVACENIEER